MNLFKLTLLFIFIGFTGCTKKLKSTFTPNHTTKLIRPLSVSFLSSHKIQIIQKKPAQISLKVFLKSETEKKLLNMASDLKSGVHQLELPEDLSSFSYIVAVVQSTDSNGNPMSAVDTYKIGEQQMINSAKENLKYRN